MPFFGICSKEVVSVNLKKRNRIRWIVVLILMALVMLGLSIPIHLYPLVDELALMQVENRVSDIINDVIFNLMLDNDMDYNDMISLEKDTSGTITALQTNMSSVNFLKAKILQDLNEQVLDMDQDQTSVPIGSVILPQLFAGQGVYMPVKVVSLRDADATFQNNFIQGGINQTVHQILMDVVVNMIVLTPSGTHQVHSTTQVVIAETVIVGSVPDSYINFDHTDTP